MASPLLIRLLLLISALTFYYAYAKKEEEKKHKLAFEKFIKDHQREFADHSEKKHRFTVFKENMRQIDELNKRHNSTDLFGVNKFADWTKEEFKQLFMDPKFLEPSTEMDVYEPPVGGPVGAARRRIDYRDCLTPVKDQGECAARWAFATVANIEYLYKKRSGKDQVFSEQAFLDCEAQTLGCKDGYPDTAFNLMVQKGVPATSEYKAYTGVKGSCGYAQGRGTVRSAISIPAGLRSMRSYLANNGPFVGTVMIPRALQYFKGGQVYRPTAAECAENVGGHAWLVAGMGYKGNQPYYIIKNSWGTSWGEKGFIRFAAGSNACNSEIRSYGASL